MPHPPLVTLTTDFGANSTYVAVLKGVLYSRAPCITLVDLCHSIRPQDVRQAAFFLSETVPWFPPRALHLVVVDPGVGTARKLVYAELGPHRILAPDNGVLTLLQERFPPRKCITLTNAALWSESVSATFHGRDILAPVAALLSHGLSPEELGPAHGPLITIGWPQPKREAHVLRGGVIHVDSFGNLITNIRQADIEQLAPLTRVQVQLADTVLSTLARTYGDHPPGTLIAIVDSSGRLEIAVARGNASVQLKCGVGTPVSVTLRD